MNVAERSNKKVTTRKSFKEGKSCLNTNTKMSVTGKNSSFKDSIKATNLKASTKYTLMSVAVDANTGKAYKDASGKSHS